MNKERSLINREKTPPVATFCPVSRDMQPLPSRSDTNLCTPLARTAKDTTQTPPANTRPTGRHVAMLWKCPNCITANLSERCLVCGTPQPLPPPPRLSPWKWLESTCKRGWRSVSQGLRAPAPAPAGGDNGTAGAVAGAEGSRGA